MPKISHHVYANIPKFKKRSDTLLIPSNLDKGYSICILFSSAMQLPETSGEIFKAPS